MSVRTAAAIQAALPTARALAHRTIGPINLYYAGGAGELEDLQQDGLLALHLALKHTRRPRNIAAFGYLIMRRAMWRSWNRCPPGGRVAEATVVPELPAPADEQQIELDDYFMALERQYGTDARHIAEQLLHPTDQVAVLLAAEVARKQRARRGTVRMRREVVRQHVRRGLGLTRNQWRTLIRQVETFTRAWVAA